MHVRISQTERRERSRSALLLSAARALSRHGYGNLNLEQVARDAGYTRGALYHQFKDKDDLVLAALRWVDETWQAEVAPLVAAESEPAAKVLALARGHAIYCRRDVARFGMALRMEFSDSDHPVGRAAEETGAALIKRLTQLVSAGRRDGSIPSGPPARAVALAVEGALEGTVIGLAGLAPHDEELTMRAVAGVLGVDPGSHARPS